MNRRLERLVEELDEVGITFDLPSDQMTAVADEIDHALRPHVHERRAATSGVIVDPTTDEAGWETGTRLELTRRVAVDASAEGTRQFTDGLSSWLVRRTDGPDEWLVFDRPAGSERDLVVLADRLGGTIVQRHPTGTVRVVGAGGVARWDGFTWHHEPPVASWIDTVAACGMHGDRDVMRTLLEFAVHDLGSQNIGAILVYRPRDEPGPPFEQRLASPPPLEITRPTDLAPLRHALSQIDGATVFDQLGILTHLGVRLVPSPDAERAVAAMADVRDHGGMRHISGRRYSVDDPSATVVVVSEDGPVTVLRAGAVLGASPGPTA